MSSAISGNVWYLSGGYSSKHVFSVCLDELISQTVSQSADTSFTSPSTLSPWQNLTDTPVSSSSLLVVSGVLLAFDNGIFYHYQPSNRSWVEAGRLSYPCTLGVCLCSSAQRRDILIRSVVVFQVTHMMNSGWTVYRLPLFSYD